MSTSVSGSSRHPRRGVALLVSLFIILILVVIGGTMVSSVDLHGKSTRNEVDAMRVQQVADAGLTHAVGIFHLQLADDPFNQLLSGADEVWNQGQGDDGILRGVTPFEIPEADAIPAEGLVLGGYRYQVRVTDDPADDNDPSTDSNQRLLVTCTATAASGDGPSAESRAIVERVASAYKVMVRGNTAITNGGFGVQGGQCAQFYLGDGIFTTPAASANAVGGWVTTAASIPSSFGPGGALKVVNSPPVGIPSVSPIAACPSGVTFQPAPATPLNISSVSGVLCYTGDVVLTGSNSGQPKALTLIATGSITVNQSRIKSAHPAGYALVAGGDVLLTGTSKSASAYVEGTVFCGGQVAMQVSSAMKDGFVYCQGNAVGSLVTQNTFSTDGKLQGGCGSAATTIGSWRATIWYPGIGS